MAEPAEDTASHEPPITIKKYANRRLYNTATSSYVTLDHLCQMVREGKDFVVYDAKTGEDITRQVLTQIIFEEENKGQNLLPISFLRQLIGLYGDSLQALVPGYLEVSMQSFAHNQDQMRKYLSDAMGEMFPFKHFEEMGRQNIAMFQRAMSMFNPFLAQQTGGGQGAAGQPDHDQARPARAPGPAQGSDKDDMARLKAQLDALQKRLDEITRKN